MSRSTPLVAALLLTAALFSPIRARAGDWHPTVDDETTFKRKEAAPQARSVASSDGKSVAASPVVLAGVFMKMDEENRNKTAWKFSRVHSAPADMLDKDFRGLRSQVAAIARRDYFFSKSQRGGPVDKVNYFLKEEHGFDIQLTPLDPDPTALAVGVVMKVDLEWSVPGGAGKVRLDDNTEVPAAVMPANGVEFFSSKLMGDEPIVGLTTTNGEKVYLARIKGSVKNDHVDAYLKAKELSKDKAPYSGDAYAGAYIPMVDFDSGPQDADVPLTNVCDGNGFCIQEFKIQYKYKMNHLKARIEVGAGATGVTRSIMRGPVPYRITGPYLMWMEVDGSIPYAMLVNKDSMKEPRF